ncbi:MAG: DEAD/DEAH box helicase [Opitutales bacterium]|nr:DEAD/DEAH box helicase [Opitutales bacterium]
MCADKLKECLNLRFGLQDFRHSQRAIIESVLSGKDTLAVMPTGGGKSLCYQLPALMFDGVTFIVSPLIALMKDQVDALNAKGIAAACINSAQSLSEQKESLLALKSGKIKLLYIAPERFKAQSFFSAIRGVNI